MDDIVGIAVREAKLLEECGFHAVMVEVEAPIPFSLSLSLSQSL